MDAGSHPGKGGHGLALASRGNEHRGLRRVVPQVFNVDEGSLRHIDIPQLAGNIHDSHHAAAFHHHLAPVFVRRVHHLLNPVHIGSKGGHDDAPVLVLRENGVKCLSHRTLGHGESGTDGIGTVCHQGQHALLAQLRKALQVNGIPKHRRVVNLKVSCVQHGSHRCKYGQGGCVLDAVVCLHEFHSEASQVHGLSVLHHLALGVL